MNQATKRLVHSLVDNTAVTGLVSLLERVDKQQPNLLRIVTYHRVDHPESRPWLYPRVTVTPEAFAAQMQFLATHYHPISLRELLNAPDDTPLPPRAVLVTFDDAYCDFAEQAWPVMQRHHIPATLFVPTAFPDHPERIFWWDRIYQALRTTPRRDVLHTPVRELPLETADQREQALVFLQDYIKTRPHAEAMPWVEEVCAELQSLPLESAVLGWDALRRLAAEGVTLGAHSRTHPLMNRISKEEARAEALGSLQDLQAQIGSAPLIFAYPSGGINDEVVQGLAQEGFLLAFTTRRGLNDWDTAHRLRLRRINVGPRAGLTTLRMQLLPQSKYLSQ